MSELMFEIPGFPDYAITRKGQVYRITPARSGKNFTRPVPYPLNPYVRADTGKEHFSLSRRDFSRQRLLLMTFGKSSGRA